VADADAFLDKARESLASAEDDLAKDRFNACARNAYYAAFQAAVAALITEGIRPVRRWEHSFVQAEFQGRLIYRRRVYPTGLRSMLTAGFETRSRADYSDRRIPRREAANGLQNARDIVEAVGERVRGSS